MKIKFNSFLESVDPFRNHNLRMNRKYRPKYKLGLIGIRFQDDEFGNFDEKEGEVRIDYQNLFSNNENPQFIKHFEDKYKIKLSNYRKGTDDYYFYFNCEIGKEKETLEKLSKDKIVKDVDYVDIRQLEITEEIKSITNELLLIIEDDLPSDIKIKEVITNSIERLKKFL